MKTERVLTERRSIRERENIVSSIRATKGRFFRLSFIKKDGSRREMLCRTGVKKYAKGGKNTAEGNPDLVTVYDIQNRGYRHVNVNRILKMQFDGLTFEL